MTKKRSLRLSLAATVAALAALAGAASANAGPGDVYFAGAGRCLQQLNGSLAVRGSNVTIYGLSTTDHVQVWHRLVDDYGRPQTNWTGLGMFRATATQPATLSGPLTERGAMKQFSRMQFFIAWYAIFGQPGNHSAVRTSTVTLADYVLYSYGGIYFQMIYTGRSTACFG
jgi:hypothetical protein